MLQTFYTIITSLGQNSLTRFTQSINVLPSIRSDQRVAKLVLRFLQFNIESGYWKFCSNLLDDHNYISFIKQVITVYKSNNPAEICNPQFRWYTLKCVIRGYTIQYSSQKRRRLLIDTKVIGTKNAIVVKFTELLFA